MISVEEALQKLMCLTVHVEPSIQPLNKAFGLVLAESILSPMNMPPFRQSAMDGYALCLSDTDLNYTVIGEVAAGSEEEPILKKGEAVRIFTGAKVPETANAVVQQEWVERTDNQITLLCEVEHGRNIRPVGEQINKGDLALEKGDVLNPAAIGFLSGLGISSAHVFPQPRISIITTGNELVKVGEPLKSGQIYESNAIMLSAALMEYHFTKHDVSTVEDNFDATKAALEKALAVNDFVMITGGISVGDYDFVGKALNEIGVEEIFYKINQKPGKPFYFGQKGTTLVAALPGNPAAALTCFYRYVLPCLNVLMGKEFKGLEEVELPMGERYQKKGDRAEFLKAQIRDGHGYVLGGQSSAMLNSFSKAHGLIYVPAEAEQINKFDLVKVLKF